MADSSSDPVEFFRVEFFDAAESSDERIQVLNNVNLIVSAISRERLKTALLPLITDISKLEGDDEVLHTLAKNIAVLGRALKPQESSDLICLMPVIENLCIQEETVVRETAIEAISVLIQECCSAEFESAFVNEQLVPLWERLQAGDQFTSRITAAYLFPILFPYLGGERKPKLCKLFTSLAKDEAPTVRRSLSSALIDTVTIADNAADIMDYFHPTIVEFAHDELREGIRASAVTALSRMATKLDESEFEKSVVPTLDSATRDVSWRVRLSLVKSMTQLMPSLSERLLGETVTLWMERSVLDLQPEVQGAAVESLEFTIGHIPAQHVSQRILPLFTKLLECPSPATKASMALVLGQIAQRVGREQTQKMVLPMANLLLQHPSREVRTNVVLQYADFCEVLGPQTANDLLFESVHAAIVDPQWRIRLALVKQIPRMARLFGSNSFFKSKWELIYFDALLDNVYAVRQAAVDSVVEIGNEFGAGWASDYLLKNLLALYDQSFASDSGVSLSGTPFGEAIQQSARSIDSYTARNTLLHAMERISIVLTKEEVSDKVLPRLLSAVKDSIPNIRFSAFKLLTNLVVLQRVPADWVNEIFLPLVEETSRMDPDADVKYFALVAILKCENSSSSSPPPKDDRSSHQL